jgi:hypothetical protein
MALVRDVGQVETYFGPFGDSVNLKQGTYHRLKKLFGTYLIVLLGDVDQAEAPFDPFGDSFNLSAR